jgi:hypothetical protein
MTGYSEGVSKLRVPAVNISGSEKFCRDVQHLDAN